jgi:hypothetical protein
MGIHVLHNGKPLADAEVKFVPEKFLGDKLPIGAGKTNKDGIALISIPMKGSNDPPGMPPGFYRVEITKDGENIPPKYNTETIFGQEVAVDAKDIQKSMKFDLEY